MTKEKKEISVTDKSTDNSPNSLIALAINKDVSVETIEKLMVLQERWEKNQAKKLFDEDMSAFQGECPVIKKNKAGGKTNAGSVAYYYATLDAIVFQTKELIKKYGFSYAIQTFTLEGKVKVACIVKHKAGHSESSDIEVPLGAKTNIMNESQVVASALTFAKRYAFCNAFGILTGDADDDANSTKSAPATTDKADFVLGKIKEETSIDKMTSYNEQIQASDKYTAKEKKKIDVAINARIGELVPA